MYYEYLGPGAAPNTSSYRITLKLYTECILNPGQTDATVPFSVFNATTNGLVFDLSVAVVSDNNTNNCTLTECHPCMNDIPYICYKIRTYQTTVDLPNLPGGYIIAYQRCCRISGIRIIQAPSNSVGETWTVKIPGTAIPGAEKNSSAKFSQNDTAIICQGSRFTFDFSATDINNDSLVYAFTPAYGGASNTAPAPPTASPPPYASVPYASGFSGTLPLGPGIVINSSTGIVTGFGPASGIYVITVTVSEYKRGTNIKIAEVRKSLHIEVTNCSLTDADLLPSYTSCDGFTVNFKNEGDPTNIQTYDWDFGDGVTSTDPAPQHTYADTGVYILKLTVNRGLPCSDSTTAPVKVFPGFHPDFTFTGQCQNVPVQFIDLTTADFGVVNKWSWNFGDLGSLNNTSILQNPIHAYGLTGTYNIEFVVETSKGCIDTILKSIDILGQPPLSVPHDTLICVIDTLQLHAIGSGSFLWSPNYMISNVNDPDPFVSPDITTTYSVMLTDAFGCTNTQGITVNVKNFVTQFGGPDTSICRSDTVILKLTSDALHWFWTENPAGNTLNDPTLKNPTARPLVRTTYHVVGNIGKCIAQNDITVTPVPYPAANAGPDKTICFGTSIQLNASGGSIYSWSPSAFLTATNIPNPVSVNPTDNVRYIVTVRDVLGCPKPVKDTMFLYVAKIKADAGPDDTSVVLGQPLQLGASGSTNYSWTPTTWLNNPLIHNPIAFPQNDINYVVRVSNDEGCFDLDTIRVHVFRFKPDLLVPNAFTPNGDGINNIFKPIPIGMKSVDIFRVYNRWGQMLYSGTGNGAGWDGTFAGKKQEMATYVWYAEGVDYLNKKIKKKGSVILIR
jgi:gliding motility-associated-like protein